ncbi:MAG: class I SAM-dependent methyltransferase [Pseudonocardiaceae bacterium]|nr:class I SAM-dependent methyltransferase [Pseudonocardiaceae bacterium]
MLDNIRDLVRGEGLRRKMRAKAIRVVDDALAPYHRDQTRRIQHLEEQLDALRSNVLDRIVEFEVRSRRDIVYAADLDAALQTSRFVLEHMPAARHFARPQETLEYALSLAPTGGMALEFGVYSGTTLKTISTARADGAVYGFDSFTGLPEDWRTGFTAGMFHVDELPEVPGAELVVGQFDDTLPGFLDAHRGPVDFVHVDGDLYSSAKTVLELVGPRMRPGCIVVFDEFFNFPNWQQHEYRAWREYVARTGVEFSYLAYTYCDEQVVVRIDGD